MSPIIKIPILKSNIILIHEFKIIIYDIIIRHFFE